MPDLTASRERLRFLRNIKYLRRDPNGRDHLRYPNGSGSPVGRIVAAELAADTIRLVNGEWERTELGNAIIAAADAATTHPVTTRTV